MADALRRNQSRRAIQRLGCCARCLIGVAG
jgi:hypothetical protein